jgi:hypothetical protein
MNLKDRLWNVRFIARWNREGVFFVLVSWVMFFLFGVLLLTALTWRNAAPVVEKLADEKGITFYQSKGVLTGKTLVCRYLEVTRLDYVVERRSNRRTIINGGEVMAEGYHNVNDGIYLVDKRGYLAIGPVDHCPSPDDLIPPPVTDQQRILVFVVAVLLSTVLHVWYVLKFWGED